MDKNNEWIVLKQTDRPNTMAVKLETKTESRLIGFIDSVGEGTFLSLRNEKQIFRKSNSLGVNYSLLTDKSISFKWIVLDYCHRNYVSSRDYFLINGTAMQFDGFDLQVFLPLSEFGIDKARKFETEKFSQQNLFNFEKVSQYGRS
jgi:hypothetical protein